MNPVVALIVGLVVGVDGGYIAFHKDGGDSTDAAIRACVAKETHPALNEQPRGRAEAEAFCRDEVLNH